MSSDDELRAAARDACDRFFTAEPRTVAPQPWDDSKRDILAEIHRYCDAVAAQLIDHRPVSTLRAGGTGRAVKDWLWDELGKVPAPTTAHDPIVALMGIPIVVDADLPEGAWRLVDRDGNTLYEGSAVPRAGD